MTSYEEEFLSTGQEARRLSIALLRFIQIDDPEWKNKYQKYLSLRFRPALSTLIREGDLTRIRALCSFAPVTESALNCSESAGRNPLFSYETEKRPLWFS